VDKLITELGPSPARDFASRAVEALRWAYNFNAKRYDPDNGDDDRFFGTAVWRSAVHKLGLHYHDLPDSEILGKDICFEIEVSGRTIRFYKMPPRLGDNVEAFSLGGSKIKDAQARLNDEQLDLFTEVGIAVVQSAEVSPSFPRLIALHQGTPTDGLRWIVVGAPSAARGWHWWEKIYDAGWEQGLRGMGGVPMPSDPEGPQAPPHDVRIKRELLRKPGKETSQS
jgi:hypothetical protein